MGWYGCCFFRFWIFIKCYHASSTSIPNGVINNLPSPSSTNSQQHTIKIPLALQVPVSVPVPHPIPIKEQQQQPKVPPNGNPSPNDWYVGKKYNNFKEEILHNSIRQLACDSWNDSYSKVLILQKSTISKRAKSIRSKPPTPNSPTPMPFGAADTESKNDTRSEDEHFAVVPTHHLMAVLLYCDFDNLRFALNATFYPSSMTETITNWKLRHAEYCHWSQFLREAVMLSSGIDMGPSDYLQNRNRNFVLYHSTTSQTSLSPKYLKICYPMSCNPHLSIVHTFSPKNGIVLALKNTPNQYDDLHFLNCNWISDYANYDENIIFGALNKHNIFSISNIINIRTSQNYQTFWNAINILYRIINGRKINDNTDIHFSEDDMHCLSLLIQSQMYRSDSNSNNYNGYNRSMSSLSGSSHRRRMNIHRMIPQYIDQIFNTFCKNYTFGQIVLCPNNFISLPLIYKLFLIILDGLKLIYFVIYLQILNQ